MRWADLYRRAAGVADYVGQGAPGRHFGRWICLNCPRDWHEPPFLPFRLPIHIHEHRERFPDHAIAWWCWDHLMVEAVHTTGWRWVYGPLYVQPPSGEAKTAATGTAAAPHNCTAGGVCSSPAFASPPQGGQGSRRPASQPPGRRPPVRQKGVDPVRTHKQPIKPIPKARNLWGGLVVEKPGGMERDEVRRRMECRRAERQMRAAAARHMEVSE